MKKLVVGVIGLGFGREHLKAVIEFGAEVAAICDTNPEKLAQYGELYALPEEKRVADWHDVLNNDRINTVIIATPDQTHRELCVAFLEAGKNVLCEKPLSLTREDMRAIVAATKKSSAKFMVGQICRFTPAFKKAKELVDAGVIGELYYVESEYAHDYLEFPGIDGWRQVPERHPIIGGGCHAVDLLRWIAGDPTEAFAFANHKMLPGWPINDCVVSVLKFPNDVIGKVMTSIGCKRAYTMRTVIYGSEGTIITDNTSDTISLFRNKVGGELESFGIPNQTMELKIPVAIASHNMTEEIRDFINCINNDLAPDPDGRQGFCTVAVCDAIVRSAATGEKIEIDYTI